METKWRKPMNPAIGCEGGASPILTCRLLEPDGGRR